VLRARAHKRPASAGPVGQRRDGNKDGAETKPIAESAVCKKACIGRLIDGESHCRDSQEAPRRSSGPSTAVRESQSVVTHERHTEGDQPAERIGNQRPPAAEFDKKDDDGEVHSGRRSADSDEPAESLECRFQDRGHRAPSPIEQHA